MAPSLSAVGRKASQVFRRESAQSSPASRRFQIAQDCSDGETSDDGSDAKSSLPPPQQQRETRPTVARSILRYVRSNLTPGSSLADLDRSSLGEMSDRWQARREENNIAMWRINSELTPTEKNPLAVSIRRCKEVSKPQRSGNALSRCNQHTTQPKTNVYRHQPKPSVPKAIEGDFFNSADSSEQSRPEGSRNVRANPNFTRRSSLPSIPSSTQSYRERQLRGTLVRNSSMNWEVVQPPITGAAILEAVQSEIRPNVQPTVESFRTTDGRAWADFSEAEFAGDSQRRLVQVGHSEWRLVSPSSQNLAEQMIPDYPPTHPSRIVPDEVIPQSHIFAGSMARRNFNKHPANNPMWAEQFSHPAVQNLTAAVQHASTDIHALIVENSTLKYEASVNAHKIRGLEQELMRSTELLKEVNVNGEDYRAFVAEQALRNLETRMEEEGHRGCSRAGTIQRETSDLYGSGVGINEHGFESESSWRFDGDDAEGEEKGDANADE
ncbi:uncharacterized protein A1O9_02222 [Exophiala aquamarina CBS 119918]|uniref:Uncharacterized protein n=1 Tax=Exophiala aquamarina CBS 119918 TaxID=1182545 RepID=A0A072PLA2_9EURO|nr:uncharacterized protein A1O9_02222 [Exophiala aquamarina CBS 119918]KEF60661.1 hypothetical protein A1O9_02222 [Exophiala aquamarina CBS 119918]